MAKQKATFEAIQHLKNGNLLTVHFNNCSKTLCDARNEKSAEQLLTLIESIESGNPSIVVSSDRMINQCVKDIPEVAWDMMDYATTPLIVELEGGQFVNHNLLPTSKNISIQMVTEGILKELTAGVNRPLACVEAKNHGAIQNHMEVHSKPQNWVEKVIKIRLNGEVEIVS